jgi:hypothetical protein
MMRWLENVVYVGKIQMFGWETSGIETTCEIHVKVSIGEIEYVGIYSLNVLEWGPVVKCIDLPLFHERR